MTKYIVKVVYGATDDNPNFKGDIRTEYVGKGDKAILFDDAFASYLILEYGYDRKSDAVRNYTYKNCETFHHKWQVISKEIVEYEI